MSYIKRPTLEEYLRFGASSGLGRRQFVNLVGEFGLAAVVAACAGSPSTGPSEILPVPSPTPVPTPGPVSSAPIISNATPNGFTFPANTGSTVLRANTNIESIMKYSTNPDTPWEDMPNTFSTTGGTSHSTPVQGLQGGGSFKYYLRAKNPVTDATNLTDTLIAFNVTPTPPNSPSAVEFEIPIVGLFTGQSAGKGNFRIPSLNLDIPIDNGRIKVSKSMGLLSGQYEVGPIKTDIGEDRYMIADVSPSGITVNLGGGRLERILNVIERNSIPMLNKPEFSRYTLRDGKSVRPVMPLKIGLLDSFLYTINHSDGILHRAGSYTMNPDSRRNLEMTLGDNFASTWTNGLYPAGDPRAMGYFKIQSKGDAIPEFERSVGWLILYFDKDFPQGAVLTNGDNTQHGSGPEVRWAWIAATPNRTIPQLAWFTDTKESVLGYPEVSDFPHDAHQPSTKNLSYVKVFYSRPPGFELPDKAITPPSRFPGF